MCRAAPHSSVQGSLSSLRRVTLRSIFCSITVHSAHLPLMLTGKAKSPQITRDKKFLCSILVPVCSRVTVRWHAVVQLYWATLVKSPSLICSPLCSLLACSDNNSLPGFLYFYTFTWYFCTQNHNFSLIYAIWWSLTHITRSYLCMNEWQRRAFSFTTHTSVFRMRR